MSNASYIQAKSMRRYGRMVESISTIFGTRIYQKILIRQYTNIAISHHMWCFYTSRIKH